MNIKELTAYRNATINAFLKAAAEDGWHMRWDGVTDKMLGETPVCTQNEGSTTRLIELPKYYLADAYRAMLAASPKFEWDK